MHDYVKRTYNVPNMFIYNIGIPKHNKHLRLLSLDTKLFYYLWVKRFFDIRREIQSFYAGFSIYPKPRDTRHKATASKGKSTFLFRPQNSTNWLFSNPPKSSAQASGAWRHSHPPGSNSIWDFYCDISEWHVCSAREHLRSCLHLTNPCTEPKGSQPN